MEPINVATAALNPNPKKSTFPAMSCSMNPNSPLKVQLPFVCCTVTTPPATLILFQPPQLSNHPPSPLSSSPPPIPPPTQPPILDLAPSSPIAPTLPPSLPASPNSPSPIHPSPASIPSPIPAPLLLPSNQPITHSLTGSSKPRSFPGFTSFLSRHPLVTFTSVILSPAPSTYKQAASKSEWVAAMTTEFQALLTNNTWSLCPRPLNHNVIRNKWVFKVKQHPDGNVIRT